MTVTNPDNTVTMTLEVISADEETEGQYSCQEQGNDIVIGNLIVEIPPQLMLKKDGATLNESIDVVFTEEVQIQCVAAEGKPSVSLSWQVNGEEKTAGVSTDMSREDERIISSMINYIPNKDDETLSCITSGQEVIPSQQATVSINVMYAPSCSILVTNETSNQFRVICTCDANPAVSGYKILVNNSLYQEAEQVFLPSTDPAIVSCSASNEIGTGTSEEKNLEPFHVDQPPSTTRVALIVAIPAVFIVLVIVIVLYIVYKKARRAEKSKEDTNKSVQAAMNMLPPAEGDQSDYEVMKPIVRA
ncbi:putative kin of IRRE-like protein 1-like [Apostichopus japonicus]|uniref:Putative kin of IRRE-like protein 1-like n=1 Tax=Stichopus japonicus TaxID=307972 RepID=A0A2G8JK46_STIJA|nr:putative kin of IRRE-like protein 1-like [Apostichopus japonicus]